MTDEERATYDPIDFDPEEFRQQIGTNELAYPDMFGTLTQRWRYPALSVHGKHSFYKLDHRFKNLYSTLPGPNKCII